MNINDFLTKANELFDPFIFESGQCHTLALALCSLFNSNLIAIIRYNQNEESSTYSHMVAEINGCCYDISGNNADERWCEQFDENNDFDYVNIKAEELNNFLNKWETSIDETILNTLLTIK